MSTFIWIVLIIWLAPSILNGIIKIISLIIDHRTDCAIDRLSSKRKSSYKSNFQKRLEEAAEKPSKFGKSKKHNKEDNIKLT